MKVSFTEHPATVGESYGTHFLHAAGFSFSMIRGGLACMVHAIFPFLCTKTGSGIVAQLNMQMITNRHSGVSIHRPAAAQTTPRQRVRAATTTHRRVHAA
jgi:hypothetical protein